MNKHLDEVFGRLWQHGLKLRPDKCRLFQQEVKFLGHIVDRSGVRPDPEKVKAVQDWPIPSTIKGVRAFLGLAGYYRRFVAGFANIARPLNSLLVGIPATKRSGTQRIVWTPDCKASFDALKEALTQAPILAYADFNKPFVVYTDASHHGLGAVLAQVQEGRERVIAYASRSLHPSERNDANYSSFKLELLALKWAITEKFKDYLMGAKFTVFTDNNPLAHLQTARLGAVEQRWVAQLASFDYDIKYRSGKNNTNADALSRFPASVIQDDPDTDAPAIASTAAVELTPEGSEWEEAQATDPDIQMVRRYVEKQEKPRKADRQAMSSRGQRLLQHWKRLQLRHNVLCRKVMDNKSHETHYQIICPSSRCQEVWRRVHEAAAHAGIDKTLVSLRKNFYWPGMEGEVRQFHQGCAACSLQKSRVEPKAPLHPVTVSYPLEVIALDFLSLGRTADEFPYILVATDQFTRFAWAIPTRDQTAQTTVKAIWANIIQNFGCPTRFHSDRGTNFESALMKELCETYGVVKSRTTPYHPAGNGSAERFNQTLLKMLRALEEEKQNFWPQYLAELVHAYNNTVHSATGYTPSFLMFGRHLRLPVDLNLAVGPQQPGYLVGGWVKDHHQKMSVAYRIARDQMKTASFQQKRHYDRSAKALPFLPGERVLVRLRNKRGRGKLAPWWSPEPFVVLEQVGDTGLVYRVRPEKGGQEKTLHRNSMKPCVLPPVVPQPAEQLQEPETALPVFYGFLPTAAQGQVNVEPLPRRSTQTNRGKPPARYGD
uniref:Gypsy retrotransposon integrase-like protein 1 n=1 Tax=Oryzias sinensis TaxID=183150 RepID=A0A8C7WS27_9TELE